MEEEYGRLYSLIYFCLPSYREGLGLSLLEAASHPTSGLFKYIWSKR